ncbi:flagellar biosynthetic protein FliR [Desulfovibrio oxyclinae]|uniref:flagellar biosynthetic protein FliR n=1 Tax=Desulfovibrio oxyclinae TaxID=63560 RepID=UPI00037D3823|nr:flagellar biosynthetic protein FliR [Desulfovibrio oxyclinae]
MDIFHFSADDMLSVILTFMRISIVMFLLPFFDSKSIPTMVKAAFMLVLTMAVWPKLSFPGSLMPASPWNLAVMAIGEVLLGLILGLAVRFLIAAVQTGGHIIGFQMGFAMVNVMDPITGVNQAITAHFLYMCTMLTFLTLNGHLYLLKALGDSFQYIPPGGIVLTPNMAQSVLDFSSIIFTLAIKIAAPVMAAVLMVDLAMAIISRAAPQMHILVVGLPVKIAVGFLFLVFVFGILGRYVADFIVKMDGLYGNILRMGAG